MATYLRGFVESVSDLPAELQRCFGLMRELDGQATDLQHKLISSAQAAYEDMGSSAPPAPKKAKGRKGAQESRWTTEMEQDSAQVVLLAEEKVHLAQQIYDYVDQRIRRLDKDIKVFDGVIAKQRSLLGLPPQGSIQAPEAAVELEPRHDQPGSDAAKPTVKAAPAVVMPPPEEDPLEPVYCYCQQVSFGEMIACDNPDCAIEWFHFECVGLDPNQSRPRGKKWYCNDCAAAMKPGRRR